MDTAQWPQGVDDHQVLAKHNINEASRERKPRPQKEQALNCPRCNSTNTKFCYYNNYSLSQPRYFCKTCRRYWTEGGSLRNVPVGGGSRKNKRSSSTTSATSNIKKLPDLTPPPPPSFAQQNPNKIHHEDQGQDLNLAYPPTGDIYSTGISHEVPAALSYDANKTLHHPNPNNSSHLQAMELLKSAGNIASRGLIMSSFMSSMPLSDTTTTSSIYPSSGFALHEFKQGLNYSNLDIGFENGYGNLHQSVQEESTSAARLFFPFEELNKQVPTNEFDHDNQNRSGHGDQANGFWSGTLGGGSTW